MIQIKTLSRRGAGDRILSTATELFARNGYNGVSTREIAANAQVNEVTIFRHYPHKRDLYLAVLKSGLQEIHLRGDLLSRISEARDGRAALLCTFDLIAKALVQKPELLRLLQYSALELKEDFDPLIRTHLGELVEVVARYLEPWVTKGEIRCTNTKTVVFALIAIVFSLGPLQRVFRNDAIRTEGMFEACAELYAS